MTYVTDTHALIHHVTDRKRRLGRRARTVFDRADRGLEMIIVPFTVLEEVLLLSEVGKVHIPLPFRDFIISLDKSDNLDLAVNDTAVLLEAATFTTVRDPYDRMIIAQARVAGLPLITGDEKIRQSGLVRTVWANAQIVFRRLDEQRAYTAGTFGTLGTFHFYFIQFSASLSDSADGFCACQEPSPQPRGSPACEQALF
jgi:PIN domain nuclease of toxin-antitoxin system